MKRNTISIDLLRELFAYDPLTGLLTRKVARGGQPIGAIVGRVRKKDGYLDAKICGKNFLVHRVIWAMHYGVWPSQELDHENGIRSANWIKNLRPGDRAFNNQNRRKPHRNNKLGVQGVCEVPSGRFQARIRVNRRLKSLGTYATVEEASAVFLGAKRELHPGNTL